MCHHHMYFITIYRGILVFVKGFTLVLHLTMEDSLLYYLHTSSNASLHPFTPLRGSKEANDASKGSREPDDASKGSGKPNDASKSSGKPDDA